MISDKSLNFPVDILDLNVHMIDAVGDLECWSVSTSSYLEISDHLFLQFSTFRKKLGTEKADTITAFELIEADLIGDAFKLIIIAYEVSQIQSMQAKPVFSKSTSPLFSDFFYDNPRPVSCDKILEKLLRKRQSLLKPFVKKMLVWGRSVPRIFSQSALEKPDVFSRNGLLNESLSAQQSNWIWLEAFALGQTSVCSPSKELKDISNLLCEQIFSTSDLISQINPSVKALLEEMIREIIQCYLEIACYDLRKLRAIQGKQLGNTLLSGTPKYIGRLLGKIYQDAGRRVIRYEHGGERPFFNDIGWPMSELIFADEYHCFGWVGANALHQNYSKHESNVVNEFKAKFRAQGSRKHQEIFQMSESHHADIHCGTVLYVPGLYLGEQYRSVSIRMKPNDIVYLNWQIWLLQELRAIGYKVIIKKHPGGLSDVGRLLSKFADIFWEERYDPIASNNYIQLFDFPGTALIDALATSAPVVFLNMGFRQENPWCFQDLKNRVGMASVTQTDTNLFRLEREKLKQAIHDALEKSQNAPWFASRYFLPDQVNRSL
jgi:hypothetical protein